MTEYVDLPGSLFLRRRWKHQAPPSVRIADPMDCPECGRSISPQPVVYGRPGLELSESAWRDEVYLAGCVVFRDFPSHRCRHCGIGLGRIGDSW